MALSVKLLSVQAERMCMFLDNGSVGTTFRMYDMYVCGVQELIICSGGCDQASLVAKRKQNAKLVKDVPRQASRLYVLRVEKFLAPYTTLGLRTFQDMEKLEDLYLCL